MPDKVFVDTNVAVYLYSNDEPGKRDIARRLFKQSTPTISTQVLSELSNTLRKKFKLDYESIAEAVTEVRGASSLFTVTLETILQALQLARKYRYSYYDCLILSAALSSGCATLFSEDMQDGQVIENTLTIVNPFKAVDL
ncbi:PIN domain-containing protein [Methylomagnum sp.]